MEGVGRWSRLPRTIRFGALGILGFGICGVVGIIGFIRTVRINGIFMDNGIVRFIGIVGIRIVRTGNVGVRAVGIRGVGIWISRAGVRVRVRMRVGISGVRVGIVGTRSRVGIVRIVVGIVGIVGIGNYFSSTETPLTFFKHVTSATTIEAKVVVKTALPFSEREFTIFVKYGC